MIVCTTMYKKIIIIIMNLHCTCNQYLNNLEVEPDYIVMFGVWRLEIRVTVIFQVYILWYSYNYTCRYSYTKQAYYALIDNTPICSLVYTSLYQVTQLFCPLLLPLPSMLSSTTLSGTSRFVDMSPALLHVHIHQFVLMSFR